MRVLYRIGWTPRARCVPRYVSLNWFFNTHPPQRRDYRR